VKCAVTALSPSIMRVAGMRSPERLPLQWLKRYPGGCSQRDLVIIVVGRIR
jgi:hypothetical protein